MYIDSCKDILYYCTQLVQMNCTSVLSKKMVEIGLSLSGYPEKINMDVNDMHHPETGVLQCYNVRCTYNMIFPSTYGCLAITMVMSSTEQDNVFSVIVKQHTT